MQLSSTTSGLLTEGIVVIGPLPSPGLPGLLGSLGLLGLLGSLGVCPVIVFILNEAGSTGTSGVEGSSGVVVPPSLLSESPVPPPSFAVHSFICGSSLASFSAS